MFRATQRPSSGG